MIYLDPRAAAFENVKLMAQGAGAYTTQAEFEARNKMNDGYEYKRILSLTASVSAVALSIILAVTIQPALLVTSLLAVIPLGITLALRANHKELQSQHLEQKNIVLNIIRDVSTHTQQVRVFKIQKLLASGINTYAGLRLKENEIDTEIKLPEFSQQALKAYQTLAPHYSHDVLESFALHINCLTGYHNRNVQVIHIKEYPHSTVELRTAFHHASPSVIYQDNNTELR